MTTRCGHLLLILLILLCGPLASANNDTGKVSIPWEEFRRLLELDKDEIVLTWEEFQKILEQTGRRYVPPFQMKQEKVVLTRAQFRKLLDHMRAPAEPAAAPPFDYLITEASYEGVVQERWARFRARLDIAIPARTDRPFTTIPLFPQTVAIESVTIGGERGLVGLDNGMFTLTTELTGSRIVVVDISVEAPAKQGPRSFSFPIPQSPITRLELDLPGEEVSVEVGNAKQVKTSARDDATHVTALLAPSRSLSLSWRRQVPEVERGPAKVYADSLTHIAIEDDAMRAHTELTLSILQNSISGIVLQVPDDYAVLDVTGGSVGEWREVEREGVLFLEIPFEFPHKGSASLAVTAERLLPEASMSADFTGFKVVDAIREKGFVGVELKSASEVTLANADGLDDFDLSELPGRLINRSVKPLLYGFKHRHQPFELVLEITKHDELPIVGTVIDTASGVTLFTEDGKLVHRIVYQVRNTSKQFLELAMPEGAEVWSVFVSGEPARPSRKQAKLLIPLNRSHLGASGLTAFDVEIIYFEKAERFGWLGRRETSFPVPDVIMSEVLWSTYLPLGYAYPRFGGTVEKEELAKGINPLLNAVRQDRPSAVEYSVATRGLAKDELRQQASQLKQRFNANVGIAEDRWAQQLGNEYSFQQRVIEVQADKSAAQTAGVVPIRIQIPTSGQVFRFAKTLVSDEPLTLEVQLVSETPILMAKAGFGLLLAVSLLLLAKRLPRLARRLAPLAERALAGLQSRYAPPVLLILGALVWNLHTPLALLALITGAAMLVLRAMKARSGAAAAD